MISRDQVVNRVRDAGWTYATESKKVLIYRKKGTGSAQRIDLPKRDLYPELLVRVVLRQAGLTAHQIEEFIVGAVKS